MIFIVCFVIVLVEILESCWKDYCKSGYFDLFVEFILFLNSLIEWFKCKYFFGLMWFCQEFENVVLVMFGDSMMYLMVIDQVNVIECKLSVILIELCCYEVFVIKICCFLDLMSDNEILKDF